MQITPIIHTLSIPFLVPLPTGPLARTASMVLVCGKVIVLVDSGVAGAEAEVFARLQRLAREPQDVATLVLTHSHPDHIGAAREIVGITGCRVAAHEAEQGWIENTQQQMHERPVPGFHQLVSGPVAVDRLLRAGDHLEIGEDALEVLHTPGHSAGSISLWHDRDGVLITGDAVPAPGEMPIFEDLAASQASLDLLESKDAGWLLSAWGEPCEGPAVRRRLNESRQWLERIGQTVAAVSASAGADPMELCRRAVHQLRLPLSAVNPLTARTFLACR